MMTTRTNSVQLARSLPIEIDMRWARQVLVMIALFAVDLLAVFAGFALAYFIRFEMNFALFYHHETPPLDFYKSLIFLIAPGWIIIFMLFGLYDIKNLFSGMREYAWVFNACTLGMMLTIFIVFFYPDITIARGWIVLSWLIISLCVAVGRFGFRRVVHHLRRKGYFMVRVLIVGANEEGLAIAHQLQTSSNAGVQLVGFADDKPNLNLESQVNVPLLGSPETITDLIEQYGVQEVIIASTALSRDKLLSLFHILDSAAIPSRISSGLYEIMTTGVQVHEVGHVPLMSINKVRLTGGDVILKRMLDLAGSIAAMLIFLPLALIIAIAIKIDSPGPVFYRRRVVGVGGKLFDAFKFRTMCVDADERLARDQALRSQFEQNHKLKDDPRVTRVGRFLRKTSLDELPQLINVFLGQMSMVGPRMITAPEKAMYGKWSMNLFTVKPGMTGLWQVSGRSNVSYEERVRLDMHYIRNYTIWFDLYLLWLTIPAVLKRRGAF
jgi:exopolysaccharide biosynthesis polyprenyl glycosylphosphotransferase